ncbi:hypothetical protein JCM15519_13600 [Fundidesulfovibrio butyratiphilus]
MESDILRPLVKQALREVLDEGVPGPGCCASCELDPGEHARHHELLRNAFSLRKQALSAAVTSLVGGGLLWLGMAAWEKFLRELVR